MSNAVPKALRVIADRFRRMGRRGAYLLSKGLLYACYGWIIMALPRTQNGSLVLLALIASMDVWGYIWVAVGMLAILIAFIPTCFSHDLEPLGFAALMALPTVWALGILASYFLPGHNPYTWVIALLFASFMASTAVTAGWKEN